MLDIEGPALHVRSLEILVDTGDVLHTQVNGWAPGQGIIERGGINDYLLLEGRVSGN